MNPSLLYQKNSDYQTISSTNSEAEDYISVVIDTRAIEMESIFQEMQKKPYFHSSLRHRIQALPTADLKRFISKTCSLPDHLIDYFLDVIHLDLLVGLLRSDEGKLLRVAQVIKYMKACRELYQNSRPPSAISYKTTSPSFISSLTTAFNYQVSSEGPGSLWEATQQIQVYMTLAAFPFIASFAIEQTLEGHLPSLIDRLFIFGVIIGAMIIAIAVMKTYQTYYPIPSQIKPFRNLTRDVLESSVDPLSGRDDIIDKVFLCWQSTHNSVRQHPLLVGEAGTGKTVILMEIARRIGKKLLNNSFKKTLNGKHMFGGSAALLISNNNGMDSEDKIEKLLSKIYPIKDQIILALDEIHVLMDPENGSRYGELLKSILDTSVQGLPYVIGATTPADYKKFIAIDASKVRRFKVIYLPALSEKQVKFVLREMMRRHYPELYVSEDCLNHIYVESEKLCEKYKGLSQPDISKRILTAVISKIAMESLKPPEEQVKAIQQSNLDNLTSRYVTFFDSKESQDIEADIETSKLQLGLSSIRVNLQRQGIEKYQQLLIRHAKSREELLRLADHISLTDGIKSPIEISPSEYRSNSPFLKKFILYFSYVLPYLQQLMDKVEQKHGIKIPKINRQIIDEQLKEFANILQAKEEGADENLSSTSKENGIEKITEDNDIKKLIDIIDKQKLVSACHQTVNGINNQKNDCFMIAAFQMILHTPPLLNHLLDVRNLDRGDANKQSIYLCILQLIIGYGLNQTIFSFQKIRKILGFSENEQEDSVEVFSAIFSQYQMDALNTQLEYKTTVDLKNKLLVKEEVDVKKYSQISEQGILVTPSLTCQFQIPLSKEKTDLQAEIDLIFELHKIDNQVFHFTQDEICYQVNHRQEEIQIKQLGNTLFFQIMRFKENAEKKWIKDLRPIQIEKVIRIGKNDYELQSFIIHKGEFKISGHYVAYCRLSHNEWYVFDDAKTPQLQTDEDVLEATKHSYFLCFQKKLDEHESKE